MGRASCRAGAPGRRTGDVEQDVHAEEAAGQALGLQVPAAQLQAPHDGRLELPELRRRQEVRLCAHQLLRRRSR
jgi:hypothetical protein